MAQPIAHDALAMTEYGRGPSIVVLADSEEGYARSKHAIDALGYRLSDTVELADGVTRLERQVSADGIMLDIIGEPPVDFDRLLDFLQEGARADRFGSVISAAAPLTDWVAARTHHARVEHLCEPGSLFLIAALAKVAAPRPDRLHDVGREPAAGRLQQLSEEVGRIATILASLSEDDAVPAAANGDRRAAGPPVDAGFVRAVIRARRLRDHYFKSDLFADPAWDMLLDLMAARLERQRVAVSSLCIAAAVPATTALRWIKTLTDHGIFVREADPQDGRRVYIELSDNAAAGLEAYLRAAQRVSPLIV